MAHSQAEKCLSIPQTALFLFELETHNPEVKKTYEGLDSDLKKEWAGMAFLCQEDNCFQVLKTSETIEAIQAGDGFSRSVELVILQSAHHKAPFTDDYWPEAVGRFQFNSVLPSSGKEKEFGTLRFMELGKYRK